MIKAEQKVRQLAKQQGAAVCSWTNEFGVFQIEVMLPGHYVWDSGYNTGVICVDQERGETRSQIWSNVFLQMDYGIGEQVELRV